MRMLFLPLFLFLGSLSLPQASPKRTAQRGVKAIPRQKTLGRVVTRDGKPWGGVHLSLVSFPVFDQPFLGKADRLKAVSDAKGRFRVELIPGRRYIVWGIGEKGETGFRATSVFKMAFARGRIRLKEGEEEAHRFTFQIEGRERWKGELLVVGSSVGEKSLAQVLLPDQKGLYKTPLWPGQVSVRVFTKAGMQIGGLLFPPAEPKKKAEGIGVAGKIVGLRVGQVQKVLKLARSAQKANKKAAKKAEKKAAKNTSKGVEKKAVKKTVKKPGQAKDKTKKAEASGAVSADKEKKNPGANQSVVEPTKQENKDTKKERGRFKQPEAHHQGMVPGIPVLELDWIAPVRLKIRKSKNGGGGSDPAKGVRLRVLPPDKLLGLFDWKQSAPLTTTDEDGLGLLTLPIPPGKTGRVSRSWKMVAESEGYCFIFPNIYRSVEYPKEPGVKRAKDLGTPLTLNLFSRKGFSIKGRLLKADGKPLAHHPLLLYTSRPSSANGWSHGRDPLYVGETGEDGSFHLGHLDPRSTQVLAVVLDEEDRAALAEETPWLDPRAVIFFREDSKQKDELVDLKEFRLDRLHRLDLKVLFLDNSPAAFSRVLIAESQMHPNGLIGMYYPIEGFSDRKGRFAILLSDCVATVGVVGPDKRSAVKRVTFKGKPSQRIQETFSLGPGRLLRGTVSDANGKPFPNATIYLNLYSSGRNRLEWIFSTYRQNNSVKSDAKGRFEVRVPAGGRIYISARFRIGTRWYYSRGLQMQVEDDLDPDPLDLQIPVEVPKPDPQKKKTAGSGKKKK